MQNRAGAAVTDPSTPPPARESDPGDPEAGGAAGDPGGAAGGDAADDPGRERPPHAARPPLRQVRGAGEPPGRGGRGAVPAGEALLPRHHDGGHPLPEAR